MLRLRDQRPERVNDVLSRFLARYDQAEDLRGKLFVVTKGPHVRAPEALRPSSSIPP